MNCIVIMPIGLFAGAYSMLNRYRRQETYTVEHVFPPDDVTSIADAGSSNLGASLVGSSSATKSGK